MAGPLDGVKIVELAGIGPGPMCAMLLADLGATVLRVDRKEPVDLGIKRPLRYNTLLRNRYAIGVDLKDPEAVSMVLELIEQSDALIEGFRPGVTERLGLGPEVCLERNPRLIYGRMTGWGQKGPLSAQAGHDINYLAITGILDAIGRADQPPSIPLNLIGDYAGGSLYLALGILAGILEARSSGKGQVVDAAIVDGAAHLATTFSGMLAAGIWSEKRGANITDSGSPFYDCYACKDGKFVSVGPIEGKFYEQLLDLLQLDRSLLDEQMDVESWPRVKKVLAARFKEKTRDEWVELSENTDACLSGVLSFTEAPEHPHMRARETYVEVDGIVQPAPAPRFSRTVPEPPVAPQAITTSNTDRALAAWFDAGKVASLRTNGIVT